jgi:hypothetical protein
VLRVEIFELPQKAVVVAHAAQYRAAGQRPRRLQRFTLSIKERRSLCLV